MYQELPQVHGGIEASTVEPHIRQGGGDPFSLSASTSRQAPNLISLPAWERCCLPTSASQSSLSQQFIVAFQAKE